MKKSFLLFIKSFVFTSLLLIFFVGYGYLFLNSGASFTEVKENKVPYYEQKPKNTNIKINYNIMLFLDFGKEELRVLFLDSNDNYDYDNEFYLNCDINILADLIDLLGGVELEINNENLSYTGTQMKGIINDKNELIYKKITREVIEKISQKGLLREDILNIIKNSETNITVNDCFDWDKFVKNLCINVLFLN